MSALIIGIIALVCTALGYIPTVSWLSFIGLIFAIVAWVMGGKMVKADPTDGKAKAGKIIGMVITILAIIGIVLAIVAMASLAALFL